MMDELKEQDEFDISNIFSIIYNSLNDMTLLLDGECILV